MQIAFVDTPGLEKPKSALSHVLSDSAKRGLVDSDVVVFVTEAPQSVSRAEVDAKDRTVLKALEGLDAPVVLAINKVDRLKDKSSLLPFIDEYQHVRFFEAVVPISATRGTNLEALVLEIQHRLPEGFPLRRRLPHGPTRAVLRERSSSVKPRC